jgi:hypothetical protein
MSKPWDESLGGLKPGTYNNNKETGGHLGRPFTNRLQVAFEN